MYRITGKMRIIRKTLTRSKGVNPDGSEDYELIGNKDILQQEFHCQYCGNTEWRDVPIVHESDTDNLN